MADCRRLVTLRLAGAVCGAAGLWGNACARAADADGGPPVFAREQVNFFQTQVRPILKAHCLKCHGEGPKLRGGFRLDSRAAILNGGDLGPAVSLRNPEESLLLQAIRYEELEMPPAGKLPAREIAILTQWVKQGLPWGAEASRSTTSGNARPPEGAPRTSAPAAAQRHTWFTQPVERPRVPDVKNPAWCRTPIDAFLLARLEAEALKPAGEADRVSLIRRVTFDLTGLPPAPDEVDAFVSDTTTGAYERLIDRLLGSPQYGEKWGRHWLDLVRYGETNGYERDAAKPFAWRYRDYVIAALNQDKPYDQFIREQLAGDQCGTSAGAEALVATGFYRLGLWDDEPADKPLAHFDGLDGVVSTAGQVFLGISINCARCHDHKADPIPQRDYYRLLAFFADLADSDGKNLRKVALGSGRTMDVMCVSERGKADTHVLLRGNPGTLGERVKPGVPALLGTAAPTFGNGTMKRLALADWLASPSNPRTARVLVNRLWQHHFGRGIVPTPNDFGGLGEPPTHAELLDWLAAEFMAGGWRIKRIQRMIVASAAYRMSSHASDPQSGTARKALLADPANRWFWRFPMRRLTAEEVRDAILAASGALNLKAGGPSVYPPIPRDVLAGQSVPGKGWPTSEPGEASRRSVYVHVKRSLLLPMLAIHDAADTDSSCPVRYTTTVPTQALGLLNGAFSSEQAARFAARLRREAPGDLAAQVRRAIRLTTARDPGHEEVKRDVAFITQLAAQARLSELAALTQYCLLALNANEFLYLD
jgi:mono/diheme cytochrome c family protein